MLRYNINIIPVTRIVNQIGWRKSVSSESKNLEFIYPPRGKDYIVDTGENDEFHLIYKTKGDRQKWLEHYDKIKKYRYARLSVSTALAASFIELINMRNMTLCIFGKSGGGKTAGVIKFPMSIHGDPKYVPTFNSTFVSLERRIVNSNNLPFAVDELQNITSRFEYANIDKFAHIVGEGVSKGRTARSGDLEMLKRFSTIALITGEQPLTGINSDQGKKRRTVEFHCKEVLPRELAENTHEFVTEHFGLIGREWIEIIKDHINEIKSLYKFFRQDFRKKRVDAIPDHINFLAAAYTADIIFNAYFRNINTSEIFNELYTKTHINGILDNLVSEVDTNNAERAKIFIKEFIESRRKHFINDNDIIRVQDPIFGSIKGKVIMIYNHRLKDELKRGGFSPEKIISELIEENFLNLTADGQFELIKS